MRKGWTSKKVHENAWGLHFTRWYIKSPNDNFYEIYRNCYFPQIRLTQDIDDAHKSIVIGQTWNEAIKKVYELEDGGTYPKSLSDDIKNSKECKMMYAHTDQSYSYSW